MSLNQHKTLSVQNARVKLKESQQDLQSNNIRITCNKMSPDSEYDKKKLDYILLYNAYKILYMHLKISSSLLNKYILSLICFARMDFSEQYYIEGDA